MLAFLAVSLPPAADAAQRIVPRIDGFGPYKLGMTAAEALAANRAAKQGACGDIAVDRQCLMLNAAVFEEPAVIYAVLDKAGARVERIVAQMDPQLTRRRAYRCVRLSEKVFALLVVVYGSKYKQSYDENRRPLPAVAWDGEELGRLVFETRCKTPDEGNPRISVVEHYPNGIKPPPVAAAPKPAPKVAVAPPVTVDATAPVASMPLAVEGKDLSPRTPAAEEPNIALAPPPRAAPVGVVETIPSDAPDTSGALAADAALATLAREVAEAKGKVPPSMQPTVQGTAPAAPAQPAPGAAAAPAEPVPTPSAPVPAATPPVQAAASEPASPPAASTPAPAGRYEVPVDIAPAATAPATAAADIAQPPAAKAAPPLPAVVDPGPVTLPPPASPVAVAAPAPAPTPAPAPATAPVATAAVQKPPAATAPDKPRPSSSETLAYAAPEPRQRPSPAGRPQPWPGRSLQTAIVPPPVNPPYYGEPGAYREPTDLEAPEPFTVPEEEGAYDRAGAADTVPAAPAALAMTDETRTARTIEAEVEQRLATAPVPYDTAPRSSARDVPPAPVVPTSLLSAARTAGRDGEGPRAAVAVPAPAMAAPAPARPPAPVAMAAVPPASPPASEKSPSEVEAPAARTAMKAPEDGTIAPVLTGGWRHAAPVPPAKPWREREDPPESAISGG